MVEVHLSDPRRARKSDSAFRTISEVATDLDVPQHVLRFWETKFPQVRPLKRGGGRRYYRPEDVVLLRRVRDLLYRDGYTIKGVQRLLRDGVIREPVRRAETAIPVVVPAPAALPAPAAPVVPVAPAPVAAEPVRAAIEPARPAIDAAKRRELEALLGELMELRALLRAVRG
ncbi:MAG: MerR family transcriptional regulator [Alphaproteobacteria bacterium]